MMPGLLAFAVGLPGVARPAGMADAGRSSQQRGSLSKERRNSRDSAAIRKAAQQEVALPRRTPNTIASGPYEHYNSMYAYPPEQVWRAEPCAGPGDGGTVERLLVYVVNVLLHERFPARMRACECKADRSDGLERRAVAEPIFVLFYLECLIRACSSPGPPSRPPEKGVVKRQNVGAMRRVAAPVQRMPKVDGIPQVCKHPSIHPHTIYSLLGIGGRWHVFLLLRGACM